MLKLPKVLAKVHIRVDFVYPILSAVCPLRVHRVDNLSICVTLALTLCDHQCYRALTLQEGHTELPDGLWKSTRHRKALSKLPCDTKIESRWHHGTCEDSRS